jgi:hypothetical protein
MMANRGRMLGQRPQAERELDASERLFAGIVRQAIIDANAGDSLARDWLRSCAPAIYRQAIEQAQPPGRSRLKGT